VAVTALPPSGLNQAALPADPTPAPVWGVTFMSQAPDAGDRLPDGWDTEGVCWTPFECATATVLDVCSSDKSECEVSKSQCCIASPFEIDVEVDGNPCAPGDREQYARDVVALQTPIAMAQKAHEVLRANAINLSVDADGNALPAVPLCIGTGLIRSNRVGTTAMHFPEVMIDCLCGIVRYEGGRQIDSLGARSFAVPGYPNLPPDSVVVDPDAADAGCFWIYGSSPYIDRKVTEIESASPNTKVDQLQNRKVPWARRRGIARIDCVGIYAVKVTACGGGCCK